MMDPKGLGLKEFKVSLPEIQPGKTNFIIITPITCEPNPTILGIVASVAALIQDVQRAYKGKEYKIHLDFLIWGNDIYEKIPELKKEFKSHYDLFLPDDDEETLSNLMNLQNSEFRSFLKNIFMNVDWDHEYSIPRGLIRDTNFYDLSNQQNIDEWLNEYPAELGKTIDLKIKFDKIQQSLKDKIVGNNKNDDTLLSDLFIDSSQILQDLKWNMYFYKISKNGMSILEFLYQILTSSNQENDTQILLVLPQTGRKLLEKIFIASEQDFTNIDKILVWFNEIDRKNTSFTTHYNILSRDISEDSDEIKDELYFSGLLNYLNCTLFVPRLGRPKEFFNDSIIKKIYHINETIITAYEKLEKMRAENSDEYLEMAKYKQEMESTKETYNSTVKISYQNDIISALNNGFLENQKLIVEQFRLIH